jgi:hypothetical protein
LLNNEYTFEKIKLKKKPVITNCKFGKLSISETFLSKSTIEFNKIEKSSSLVQEVLEMIKPGLFFLNNISLSFFNVNKFSSLFILNNF